MSAKRNGPRFIRPDTKTWQLTHSNTHYRLTHLLHRCEISQKSRCPKEFLEAGKRRLSGDTARQATSPEVKDLRSESLALKECVADLTLENRLLKKSMTGAGEFEE